MTGVRIPLHGRTHLPGGSDPIPFTEQSAVYGQITRDGGATTAITSGSLSATTTLIAHNLVTYEQGVDCDVVSSPTRITILESGLYVIRSKLVDVDGGSSDYGLCCGYGRNATGAVWTPTAVHRRTLSGHLRFEGIEIQPLSVGDYVTQVVGQNSGSTSTLGYLASLTVHRIPGPFSTASQSDEIDGGSP